MRARRATTFEKRVVFCSDTARVVRAGELLERYERETVREIAGELGVGSTIIWRYLRELGVEPRQMWPKREDPG